MEKLDKSKSYCFFRLPNNCDLPFLLRIEEEKGFLTEVKAVSFDKSLEDKYLEDYQPLTSLLSSACEQFTEYFTGNRRKFGVSGFFRLRPLPIITNRHYLCLHEFRYIA